MDLLIAPSGDVFKLDEFSTGKGVEFWVSATWWPNRGSSRTYNTHISRDLVEI